MHRRRYLIIPCLLSMAILSEARADAYADARTELLTAYQQADFPAMRTAARKALAARPGFPGALFNLALAQALDDDPAASLLTLRDLLSAGVDFGVGDIAEFAGLKDLLEWGDYAAAAERLYEPVGFAEVVATLDIPDYVPEGIAIDTDGRFYLGSIRHGQLTRLGDSPEVLSAPTNGHWSVFGVRVSDDGELWFASAAVPQYAHAGEDVGKSGLFRFDLKEKRITHRALLPASEEPQLLGDLVLGRGEVIYATDSLTGILYSYQPASGSYTVVVDHGVFGSPQGLVLDESGEHLYVADYVGGLFRVALDSGEVSKVAIAANVTDFGIDGLYRYDDKLIAIQNGIRPHRVVALQLSADGSQIIAGTTVASNLPEFDEPTLGHVAGDDFYFVANSHWNRFDAENGLPEELSGPIILRVPLSGIRSF